MYVIYYLNELVYALTNASTAQIGCPVGISSGLVTQLFLSCRRSSPKSSPKEDTYTRYISSNVLARSGGRPTPKAVRNLTLCYYLPICIFLLHH